MLISCPECDQRVSEKARACPGCGFPIAEHIAERRAGEAADEARRSRVEVGSVDCVPCKARGFRQVPANPEDPEGEWLFDWCVVCDYTGRVVLCESTDGFYAVSKAHLTAFLAGEADPNGDTIIHLGAEHPGEHRYPKAGIGRVEKGRNDAEPEDANQAKEGEKKRQKKGEAKGKGAKKPEKPEKKRAAKQKKEKKGAKSTVEAPAKGKKGGGKARRPARGRDGEKKSKPT